MAWSGRGGALCVCHVSCVADKRVVLVARASIKSCNCGPDSSWDDRQSGGSWALFLFLVIDVFLCGFHLCFQFGSPIREQSKRDQIQACVPAHHQKLNDGSGN